jgi:hypothetical protein
MIDIASSRGSACWSAVALLTLCMSHAKHADGVTRCQQGLLLYLIGKPCCRVSCADSVQAGLHKFTVTPPSTLPYYATVTGNPLSVVISAGPADPTRSALNMTLPADPVVGSVVTAQITLVDAIGNKVTAPPAGQYTNAVLQVFGTCAKMTGVCRLQPPLLFPSHSYGQSCIVALLLCCAATCSDYFPKLMCM